MLGHGFGLSEDLKGSSVATALSEEGVLLFALPYREPKEDGGRNATDSRSCRRNSEGGVAVVRGSCRLPRFVATPGP
jgi:hypothetical protein